MTKPDISPHPRTVRFRELKGDIGLSLPALATALGWPLGTLTGYTHSGTGSRVPPQRVNDEMEVLLLENAKRVAAEHGYVFKLADEADHDWLDGQPPNRIRLLRTRQSAFDREVTEVTNAHS